MVLGIGFLTQEAKAADLYVPGSYTTIQSAINAAVNGDRVLVDDGTYTENINFLGKGITVESINGTTSTIIDGNTSGSVVTFKSSEGTKLVLSGFTIQNGRADYGGGIFCYYYSSPTITNCTISGNSADCSGGGICCYSVSPTVVNSILWGDTPDEIYLSDSSIDITYSDIQGGYAGEGNIDADPLFVGAGDYHLTPDSPCIDTGTSTGAPPDDIDGDIRPQGPAYDMGSDEYVEEIQPPVPDIKANGSDGTITTSGPVSITIELNSGSYAGQNADWWHVADTPFGWYWYQVSGNTWVSGLTVSYQGPLFDLTPPFNTLNTPLPSGTYTIYFGVDMNMNGVIDFGSLYYDRVVVIVP
ncbi:MAG: choice-of-anchor Q domain-containing protein [bacterium]